MGKNNMRRLQAGQAVVYLLAILPAVCLGIFLVYNTATVTRQKMKLQNTADAITYSTATVYARQLNFLAYTNRAMAANEAGVALMASLQTSTGMVISGAANLYTAKVEIQGAEATYNLVQAAAAAARLDLISAIKYLISWGKNVAKAAKYEKRADKIAKLIEPSAIPWQLAVDVIRGLNVVIAAAQATTTGASLAEGPLIANDVLKENDPSATLPPTENVLLIGASAAQLLDFVRFNKSATNGTNSQDDFYRSMRFAYAAQATRDDFTKNRRIAPTWISEGISSVKKDSQPDTVENPVAIAMTAMLNSIFSWKGGTELVANNGNSSLERGRIRWQSADSFTIGPAGIIAERPTHAFAFGASAAASKQGYSDRGWSGYRLPLYSINKDFKPDNQDPKYYTQDSRNYGELTDDGGVNGSPIYAAGKDKDGDTLILPAAALQFNSKFRYKPRSEIGKLTKNLPFMPYYDVKKTKSFKAYEQDTWQADLRLTSKNPRKWGAMSDNGPTMSIVVAKGKSDLPTAEQKKFGYARDKYSIGLKDSLPSDQIRTVSSAQIYFKRPQDRWQRRDLSKDDAASVTILGKTIKMGFTGGYIEHKNLFSPYWLAHNVEPSAWARTVAIGGTAIGDALKGNTSDNDNSGED